MAAALYRSTSRSIVPTITVMPCVQRRSSRVRASVRSMNDGLEQQVLGRIAGDHHLRERQHVHAQAPGPARCTRRPCAKFPSRSPTVAFSWARPSLSMRMSGRDIGPVRTGRQPGGGRAAGAGQTKAPGHGPGDPFIEGTVLGAHSLLRERVPVQATLAAALLVPTRSQHAGVSRTLPLLPAGGLSLPPVAPDLVRRPVRRSARIIPRGDANLGSTQLIVGGPVPGLNPFLPGGLPTCTLTTNVPHHARFRQFALPGWAAMAQEARGATAAGCTSARSVATAATTAITRNACPVAWANTSLSTAPEATAMPVRAR